MQHRKLIWQIFPSNILITFLAMLAVTWYGSISLHDFYMDEMETGLKARALLISERVNELLSQKSIDSLRSFCIKAGRESSTRITVIDISGKVLADSNEDPDSMDYHDNRVEVQQALQGKTGTSLRYSRTLGENMLYVAIALRPLAGSDSALDLLPPVAILRTSVPVTSIDRILHDGQIKIAMGAIPVIVIAALITFFVSRRISMPLERMRHTAQLFSGGDFSQKMSDKLGMSSSREVVALAGAMDHMAVQLNERIKTINEQRNELETVFSSMIEAVIAIDTDWKIVSINKAAAKIFSVDAQQTQGKILHEVVRNIDLQRQIEEILTTGQPNEEELVLHNGEEERLLRIHGVQLLDSRGTGMGVLLVVNDVTHLRRLENVRRDFVANVSHELKTPVTSIRGYVETLLDGALDDREDALHFLGIVLNQTNRLTAIIDDLLSLSRLEEKVDENEILLTMNKLKPALQEVVQSCQFKADEKNIKLFLSCPDSLQLPMNVILLEQAVTNLVINAIKYSDKGTEVSILVEEVDDDGGQVIISVVDHGAGIARQHLPRLFERFYRSDKARSRKLGGTGLGLSIVKHIAQAHGGDVEVQSEVSKGTSFFIRLPLQETVGEKTV